MNVRKRTKINGYNLEERLGEGLTSCVYKAIKRHHSWGIEQTVALKILKSKDLVPTFAQEVHSLGRIDSPHCVKFYDWIDSHKTPVLVLEYLDGVTLDECLRGSRFSPSLINEIIAQVQAGLRDLQKHHLKHGDLSPKNIFITKLGVVKLLDFGLSLQKTITAGTLAYLSPEGWEQQEQTSAADLFSLGLIKFEMETGERVYTREQAQQRMVALKDKNSLLQQEPKQREFLPLTSSNQNRDELAKIVAQRKEENIQSVHTTMIVQQKSSNLHKKLAIRSTLALFTFFMMVYSHALHPATRIDSSPALFRLEVRSFRWAQISLYQKQKDKNVLLQKQYTPFLHKGLSSGTYQIQWSMSSQQGVISVHLNKNQRILLP